MIYVAVVCKLWERSGRPMGDWACFINKNKNAAIQQAIKAKQCWERKGEYGPYKVLVGELRAEAALPQQWKLLADFCPVHGLWEYRV